jgi:hypothetical protein
MVINEGFVEMYSPWEHGYAALQLADSVMMRGYQQTRSYQAFNL